MAARVSFQFHNTEVAAAGAAAEVAQCKVAEVYMSMSINRGGGIAPRGQSRAHQKHTAKVVAGSKIDNSNNEATAVAVLLLLPLCCCCLVLLLQLLLRLAATDCVATACCLETEAASLWLTLSPLALLGCLLVLFAVPAGSSI